MNPIARTRRRARRCPICKAPAAAAYDPFCSARCADVDLGRWLSGDYRIATNGGDGDEEDGDGPAGGDADPSA